jgi:hypothetical protein
MGSYYGHGHDPNRRRHWRDWQAGRPSVAGRRVQRPTAGAQTRTSPCAARSQLRILRRGHRQFRRNRARAGGLYGGSRQPPWGLRRRGARTRRAPRDGARSGTGYAARHIPADLPLGDAGRRRRSDPRGHRAKYRAEQAIRQSGVPYTIFKPTYFMETLPRHIQSRLAIVLGRQPHPLHMVAAADFARMVSRSFQMPKAANRIFFVHGPEAITIPYALHL